MTVALKRMVETPHGTFGTLTVPGITPWYTVERRHDVEHPLIPTGTYDLRLDFYHKGNYPVYEVIVPGRSRILIHAANKAEELLGCIAPGMFLGFLGNTLAVLNSRMALNQFMSAMKNVAKDYLVVI